MDPVAFDLSDGEETYVIGTDYVTDGWTPTLGQRIDDRYVGMWPVCVQAVAQAGPYPTPGRCLLALAEAVIAELCGVKT